MRESQLQRQVIKWLKNKGFYVIKCQVPPAPTGCPDIIFMFEGFWGAIEFKNSPTARYQPLQKETLKQLDDWSWAKCVNPINWEEVKGELERIL